MSTAYNISDNICAISSPSGTGGIALLRISGNESIDLVNKIFSKNISNAKGYSLHFGTIVDNNETIDEVLVSIFRGLNSFTGEDTVEISCHGSQFIQNKILQLLIHNGCRMAQPGEFSQRAFYNGKMDLSQTEAIADLIHAQSESSHKMAMNQMKGGFTKELNQLRASLIEFASLVELELDFSEEDVEFADRTQLKSLIDKLSIHLNDLIESFKYGNAIKNGVQTALIGMPNAGKSTLLNGLLNENRAIVSDIPGTTRDTIEETLTIDGILYRFVDTAGIRNASDSIEKMGVEKTYEKIKSSSIVIYLYDLSNNNQEDAKKQLKELNNLGIPVIKIANKADQSTNSPINSSDLVISALNNEDILKLKETISSVFSEIKPDYEGTIVSNARHFEALSNALSDIKKCEEGLKNQISGDLLAMDIRQALYHLGTITGEITNDELLGNIFANFCIGK
ncbi:MAG: tRNA uridine-5-carboxymethylaminomethyl(34) synthesis GTPase MnmE [Crocinitomicaceae bacterium]|nr:tRNA uridine-5-carboxymethylaminomethyl(34) synthesis GTPase MnmE [Crocinitomicaceae bacterium]|tara:strand:- start:17 stop:1375 length:1359 start_codon:yes stop_codon:yes gene_type:complete